MITIGILGITLHDIDAFCKEREINRRRTDTGIKFVSITPHIRIDGCRFDALIKTDRAHHMKNYDEVMNNVKLCIVANRTFVILDATKSLR